MPPSVLPTIKRRKHRRSALGLYLSFALVPASPLFAQSPEGSRGTEPSPSIQREGEGQADRGHQPSSRFSVPVRIIEDPEEAERTEQRAQRAEKRETDDLVAQQRAATAAERAAGAAASQNIAAWWQTGIAGVGTAFLLYTLWLTRQSVKLARQSAEAAIESARAAVHSERPFVYVSDLEMTLLQVPPQTDGLERDDLYTVAFMFTNYGRTPAFITEIGYNFSLGIEPPPVPDYRIVDGLTVEIVILPGAIYKFDEIGVLLPVSVAQKVAFQRGDIFPWLWGNIQFRDFLDGVGETGFIAFRYLEVRVGGRAMQDAAFRFRGPAAYTYQRYSQNDGRTAPRGTT